MDAVERGRYEMLKFLSQRRLEALWLAAAIVGAAMAGGCHVHAYPRPAVPTGKVVVVEAKHVHSRTCGHYKHRGRWYHLRGHVHGRGCGHVLEGRVWVLR